MIDEVFVCYWGASSPALFPPFLPPQDQTVSGRKWIQLYTHTHIYKITHSGNRVNSVCLIVVWSGGDGERGSSRSGKKLWKSYCTLFWGETKNLHQPFPNLAPYTGT